MYRTLFFAAVLFFHTVNTFAGNSAGGDAPGLAEYRIVQYASVKGLSPRKVLFLDNNDEIILACIDGLTRSALTDCGQEFKESQIQLLKAMRLLTEKDKILKTNFPVFDQMKTERLRNVTKDIAGIVFQEIKKDVSDLTAYLKKDQREKNAYSILFSYVVDGLVWRHFVDKDLSSSTKITKNTPFWAGEVWAFYPPRKFSCGTNQSWEEGVYLAMNWSNKIRPIMKSFYADRKCLSKLLDNFNNEGKAVSQDVLKVFGPFKIFDSEGRFRIPVIDESAGNFLHKQSNSIAEMIALKTIDMLDFKQLIKDFNFRDEKQALVCTYHEVMWDLMLRLESEGLVRKPAAFTDGREAGPEDIADITFLVK